MSQAVIVLGDKTDHGGTVIGGATAAQTHGKQIARVGDMVSCPRCRGIFPIIQGDPSLIFYGAPTAYHGCKVACGATLISSQTSMTTAPSGGGGGGGDADGAILRFGSVGAGLAAACENEPADGNDQRYHGRFQLINQSTGQPVGGQNVRVRSSDGQCLTGTTDAQGYTQWVWCDRAETLTFELVDHDTP